MNIAELYYYFSQKGSFISPPPEQQVNQIDHSYFAVPVADSFVSKAEMESYITADTMIGIEPGDIAYLQSVRNEPAWSDVFDNMSYSSNVQANETFTGIALQYLLEPGNTTKKNAAVTALNEMYTDMVDRLENFGAATSTTGGGNYQYMKDPFGLTMVVPMVITWLKDLFDEPGANYTPAQYIYKLREVLDEGFASDHKWPAQNFVSTDADPAMSKHGGLAGHQGTMLFNHYFVALAEKIVSQWSGVNITGNTSDGSNVEIQTWDGLMGVHFAEGGLKQMLEWVTGGNQVFYAFNYGGEKIAFIVMMNWMFWKLSGKTKYLLNTPSVNVAWGPFFFIRSDRRFFCDGDVNPTPGQQSGRDTGYASVFHATADMLSDPALATISLMDWIRSSFNRYHTQNEKGIQPLFRVPRLTPDLNNVPTAKYFGSPTSGIIACNFHSFDGIKNANQVKVYDRIGDYWFTGHANKTILETSLYYNGGLFGHAGHIDSIFAKHEMNFHRDNAGGCSVLIYDSNEADTTSAMIAAGGTRWDQEAPFSPSTRQVYWFRDVENPDHHFKLAEQTAANIIFDGKDWKATYLAGKSFGAFAYREQSVTREFINFNTPGTYPLVKFVFTRIKASSTAYKKQEVWNFFAAQDTSGSRITCHTIAGYTGKGTIDILTSTNKSIFESNNFVINGKSMPYTVDPNNGHVNDEVGGYTTIVQSTNGQLEDHFLSAITCFDETDSVPAPAAFAKFESGNVIGGYGMNRCAVFSKDGTLFNSLSFNIPGSGTYDVMVANLSAGDWVVDGSSREVKDSKRSLYIEGVTAGNTVVLNKL